MSPAANKIAKPSWQALYDVAAPQRGYFSMVQAANAGYSPPLLAYYVKVRHLERAARGIFRLVHFPPSDGEDLVVAWLWSERRGIFSHETALACHEMSDVLPAIKHLTLPLAWQRRRLRVPPGVMLHFADVADDEKTWHGPVPVTTPLRTIADSHRAAVSTEFVNQAVADGVGRGLFSRAEARRTLRGSSPSQARKSGKAGA